MPKSPPLDPQQVELDEVLELLDQSVQTVQKASQAVQEYALRAKLLAQDIREQSGRIRQVSDTFRLQFGTVTKQEIARVSQRPPVG